MEWWDWGDILNSAVGSMLADFLQCLFYLVLSFLVWLSYLAWTWTRNRKESVLQNLRKIKHNLSLLIRLGCVVLAFGLLQLALNFYDPILGADFSIVLARLSFWLLLIFLVLFIGYSFFPPVPQGKDRILFIEIMLVIVLMVALAGGISIHSERARDKLLQTLEVEKQAATVLPSQH